MERLLQFADFSQPLVQALLVGAWLGSIGLLAEGLYLTKAVSSEVTRKIVHVGAGNSILLAWWLQTPTWMGIAASLVFCLIALLSYWLPILPGINSVGRQSLGTFFYAASIGILTALFWPQNTPEFAAIGILTMTWGDGLAALVGQSFGAHAYQVWGIQKSWEGSGAMYLVSFAVSGGVLGLVYGISWQTIAIGLSVAAIATLLEAFSKLGVDNLTVPIGSAVTAALLIHSWHPLG